MQRRIKPGSLESGALNHILDVPGGIGVAHRGFRDAGRGLYTGFTVIQTAAQVNARRAAGVFALNGAGELVGSFQIREWGFLDTPILLTNTPSVGRGYEAVSQWMMKADPRIGETSSVVIPVVGECDDSVLNDPRIAAWGNAEVAEALDEALAIAQGAKPSAAALAQGDVGGGSGMVTFELKAGIGSASRKAVVGSKTFTVGVMLQTNFGLRHQLTMLGHNIGPGLKQPLPKQHREGSCIGVLATDAPLTPLGLERLARRMGMGLARTGSHAHHGSGEIFVAFSTAAKPEMDLAWESAEWNPLFWAAVEASEEAVYNSLIHAKPVENARATVAALDAADLAAFGVTDIASNGSS